MCTEKDTGAVGAENWDECADSPEEYSAAGTGGIYLIPQWQNPYFQTAV